MREPISATASASGGTGNYEYAFQAYRDGVVIGSPTAFGSKNAFIFTPKQPGEYKVLTKVRDGAEKASANTGDIHDK